MERIGRSIRRRSLQIIMVGMLAVMLVWIMGIAGAMDRVVWISQLLNSLWE